MSAAVQMPIHAEHRAALYVYTVLMCLVTLSIVVWWAASPARRKDWALPLLLVGGAISGLLEPFLDNVVLFWYPPHQSLPTIHAFGRSVPMFVPIGYAWFCGSLLFFVARIYQRGVTRGQVWMILGGVVVVDYVAIALTSWIGVAGFFGSPPLSVGGYPLWWAAIDGTDVVLGGAVVYYLLPWLTGRNRLWLVLVPPIMIGIATGAVGWPISTALHSGWGSTSELLAALATIGFGCAFVHLVASAIPRRFTFGPDGAGTAPAQNLDSRALSAPTATTLR
jgi:hypothetical protein